MNSKFLKITSFALILFSIVSCNVKRQEYQSTVSVSGTGTVLAQPDMARMNINFSHVAPTTTEAKSVVDQTMQQILMILQAEGVEDSQINTVSLNFDIEYVWRNGRMVRIGQRAQQTIVVSVNDIINNPERFPILLDKITAIDRVEVRNIQFDIETKTKFFAQSRNLAYQKALEKAEQYASLSGRKLGKALTISEERSRDVMQARPYMSNVLADAVELQSAREFHVPTGEREVTTEIFITFLLE